MVGWWLGLVFKGLEKGWGVYCFFGWLMLSCFGD